MNSLRLLVVFGALFTECYAEGSTPVEIHLPGGILFLDVRVSNYTKTPPVEAEGRQGHDWAYVGMFSMDKNYMIDYFHSSNWKKNFPNCDGHRQSPRNINPKRFQLNQQKVWSNFDKVPKEMMVINNGNTAQLIANWNGAPYLQGHVILPYRGKYVFSDVTFHWTKYGKGSEHVIKGIRYSLEAQLVFYKEKGNKNLIQAIEHDDHIAIVSVLYEISPNDNDQLTDLIEGLKKTVNPRTMSTVAPFALESLLPSKTMYYTYPGSITIPPCSETVTWLVMSKPAQISLAQLDRFRDLVGNNGKIIISNARTLSRYIY